MCLQKRTCQWPAGKEKRSGCGLRLGELGCGVWQFWQAAAGLIREKRENEGWQSGTRLMLRRCLIERDETGQEKGQLTRSPWHLFLAGRREGKPFAAECSLGWGGGEQYTLLRSPSSAAKQNSIGRRWVVQMSGSCRGPLARADHAGRSVASAMASAFAPRLVPLVWYLGASDRL